MMKRNLIINFHEIFSASWFEEVIIFLRSQFVFVELNFFEYPENYSNRKGFCHITFDDGDKSFYTIAYPILIKYKIPATLFVSPKIILNKENFWFQEVAGYSQPEMIKIISRELSIPEEKIFNIRFENILKCLPIDTIQRIVSVFQKEKNILLKPFRNMNLEELLEVDKSGFVAIGAHTMNHPILHNENDENCYYEITESIRLLEAMLGHPVEYFAFPNGEPNEDFGVREMSFLKRNKIKIAVSLEQKYISVLDNKLSLPRLGITYGSVKFIHLKLLMGSNWRRIKSLMTKYKSHHRKEIKLILERSNSYV